MDWPDEEDIPFFPTDDWGAASYRGHRDYTDPRDRNRLDQLRSAPVREPVDPSICIPTEIAACFICPIYLGVAVIPAQHQGKDACQRIFCSKCIGSAMINREYKTQPFGCPMRCAGRSQPTDFGNITTNFLELYEKIKVPCVICGNSYSVLTYEAHQCVPLIDLLEEDVSDPREGIEPRSTAVDQGTQTDDKIIFLEADNIKAGQDSDLVPRENTAYIRVVRTDTQRSERITIPRMATTIELKHIARRALNFSNLSAFKLVRVIHYDAEAFDCVNQLHLKRRFNTILAVPSIIRTGPNDVMHLEMRKLAVGNVTHAHSRMRVGEEEEGQGGSSHLP